MTPKIHLPETVLGMDVTLGEEQVVGGLGIDIGDAVAIPVDIHGAIQTAQLDFAVQFVGMMLRTRNTPATQYNGKHHDNADNGNQHATELG